MIISVKFISHFYLFVFHKGMMHWKPLRTLFHLADYK